MDKQIELTFKFIGDLTKEWDNFDRAREAYKTPLAECIIQRKTGCTMKARFAQLLLTLLGYEVEIVHGYYKSPERWLMHSWVKINGKEYDPTRNDYAITEKHSYTNPDPENLDGWEEIIENL